MATVISVGGSGSGGGGENCIVVHVDDGATVVATHSSGKRYTAVAEGGVATIAVTDVGEFVITADLGGVEATATAEVMDNFVVHLNGIYGIQRDITATTPQWARTDDAVGMMATASVGVTAGHSDFDKVYPWKGMKREVFPDGDVMVKIPKFYFARYREGNIEHIKISGSPAGGLQLHPAFNHAGLEQDCIYVGAYKSVGVGAYLYSLSGYPPYTNTTRKTYRDNARLRVAGWNILDISTLSAIQMLYLVEFAHNSSQNVIGRGYVDGNSAAINTGTCDNVPNLTGRPAGTDGKTDIVYRGIEGLWGNVWEFVDGINWYGGTYYVCNDPSKYEDDTNAYYDQLSYAGGASWSGAYITELGLDNGENIHVMLPRNASGGSEGTYYCDATWGTTGWRVYQHGGNWQSGSSAGLFTAVIDGASSAAYSDMCSRLIYIP